MTSADLDETYLETHEFKMVEGRAHVAGRRSARRQTSSAEAEAKKRAEARPPHSYDDPETLRPRRALSPRDRVRFVERVAAHGAESVRRQRLPVRPDTDHLMIYTEVVHDARVIRIGGEHVPPTLQKWLGDSIAHWEGDTLVVDTTNFTPKSHFKGSGRTPACRRTVHSDAKGIGYHVTVEDLETWDRPWAADIPFISSNQGPMYEYACHEANYAVEMSLRGARADEKTAQKARDR